MIKMNPEVKSAWVAALRSGEYKQGHGDLKTKDGFCCLGVACDLYAKENGIPAWSANTLGRGGDAFPDDPVCDWAGFPCSEDGIRLGGDFDPKVRIRGLLAGLSEHNDHGATFAEIADAIEAQL